MKEKTKYLVTIILTLVFGITGTLITLKETGYLDSKIVEKTVKEKVAEVKAAAADPEVYVQYQGNESNLAVITERIKKQYVEEGHKESDIKSLKIYLKPEDASAYYVINDNNSGKVFLF